MTGRLFIHIGPPKTATTSLQIALENLYDANYRYVGVLQPRTRGSQSLARQVYSGLFSDENKLSSALKDLEKLVDEGNLVLLSEEMLSLSDKSATTATKLKKLSQIVAGIPTTVLVTLRDPMEAIPSLYQELYDGLPISQRLVFSKFCKSKRIDCYDYQHIQSTFSENGVADIRWVDFRSIKDGSLTTHDIFGEKDLWCSQALIVRKTNISKKSNDGQARALNAVTMRSIGSIRPISVVINSLNLRNTRAFKALASMLDGINLKKSRHLTVTEYSLKAEQLSFGYKQVLESIHTKPAIKVDEGK